MRAVLLAGLLLTGCATAPEPRVQIKEVRIPVSVPCRVKLPPEPTYADELVPLDADLFTKAKALLQAREQRKAYQAELEAAAKSCS